MAGFFDLGNLIKSPDAGIFMQAFGGGFSAMGAYQSAENQQNLNEYQAQIDQNNAIIADMQAKRALQVGESEASDALMKGGQIKKAQIASFAANGIDINSGSVLDTTATTDFTALRDAATIKQNAIMQAWGLKNQAANYTANSNMMQSSADAINPLGSFASSLLGSATKVAQTWYKGKQSTGLPSPTMTSY